MNYTCENCQYVVTGEKDKNNVAAPAPLHCRRFPPQVMPVQARQGVAAFSVFPQVDPNAWCGEFAQRGQVASG